MNRVRIFLKTPFFDFRPGRGTSGERVAYAADVMALEGSIEEAPGGLQVAVTRWLSGTGAEVDHAPATLILPAAKIDHMLVLGGDA